MGRSVVLDCLNKGVFELELSRPVELSKVIDGDNAILKLFVPHSLPPSAGCVLPEIERMPS